MPTEAVAIGRALEEEIAAANAARQREAGKEGGKTAGRGRPKVADSLMENVHKAIEHPPTRDQVGKAVGLSGKTYTKAKAVVLAAESNPDRYGDLVTAMDATGTVEKAYQTLQRREATML